MRTFIDSLATVAEDIINQLINKDIKKTKTECSKQINLDQGINVITSVISTKNSFQIIISFSEELSRKVSSLVHGGIPIVIIDKQTRQIVIEISKLIVANSLIYLEDYDQTCRVSPPCLMQSSYVECSQDEIIVNLEFTIMKENLTISIITSKNVGKNIYS